MEATTLPKNLFAVLAGRREACRLAQSLAQPTRFAARRSRAHQDRRHRRRHHRPLRRREAPTWPRPCATPSPPRELQANWCSCARRLLQDFVRSRWRQLHRLKPDLRLPPNSPATCAPSTANFTGLCAILRDYPTAAAFRGVSVRRLAACATPRPPSCRPGPARQLIEAARRSVGQHHSATYRLQIRYACDDLDTLRRRLRDLDRDLDRNLLNMRWAACSPPSMASVPRPRPASSLPSATPPTFAAAARFAAMSRHHPRPQTIGQTATGTALSPPSATPSCAPPCGCQPCPRYAATPGCVLTTSGCSPAANCPRSPLGRLHVNCCSPFTASPSTANPSCRTSPSSQPPHEDTT